MRAMSRVVIATVFVVVGALFLGAHDRPAEAQAPNGECFEFTEVVVIGNVDSIVGEYNLIVSVPGQASVQTALQPIPCPDEGGEDPNDPDEVLGLTLTPDEVLAFTGAEVNTTVAIGASMIAAGSLAVYAARRRENGARESLAERLDESISG